MVSSMSAVRTVSTLTREVATGLSWITARTMSPVRPIPPAVAQNSSGSDGSVSVRSSPPGRTMSADRHLPGARGHRHEPAGRQARHHELLQADAGLAAGQAGGRVQVEDPVQPGGGDHQAAVALRRVVVAAAKTTCDHLACGGLKQPGRAGYGGWLGQLGPGRRYPAPAGEADTAAWHSDRIVAAGLQGPTRDPEPRMRRIAAALAGLLGVAACSSPATVQSVPSRPPSATATARATASPVARPRPA